MAKKENIAALRKELRKLGIKLSRKKKAGNIHVDLIIEGQQIAVIIDPCTNGCGCPEHYEGQRPANQEAPSSGPEPDNSPWGQTPTQCMARMERENHRLQELGWNVIRIWEHDMDRSVDYVVEIILEKMGVEKR